MVLGLSSNLEQAESSTSVESRIGEHFEEVSLAYVVRAGAGHEQATGTQHFQSAQVKLLVAAKSGVEIALGLGEGRRIQNDGVVAAIGGSIVLQQVKGVGFDPFDLSSVEQSVVEGGVLVGDLEGSAGAVDAGHLGATRGEVEGKAALVAEDVQGFSL